MAKAEAPRMEGISVQRETTTAPSEANIKQYIDLLWVVAAGAVGVSLLCVTAGIALANPAAAGTVLQPQSIIQIAVDNVNTAAALTMEAFPQDLITPTVSASDTPVPLSITVTFAPTDTSFVPTITATNLFVPMTGTQRPRREPNSNLQPLSTATLIPTRTSSPIPPTLTNSPAPTITNTPAPTNTPRPTRTRTPIPSPTDTSAPIQTDTLAPLPTDTSAPIPTDTSAPPPTNTSAPVPTDTSAPPPTNTSAPPPTNTPTGP